MAKKFRTISNKKDNESDTDYLADSVGEIISPISAFCSFVGTRGAPTSVI